MSVYYIIIICIKIRWFVFYCGVLLCMFVAMLFHRAPLKISFAEWIPCYYDYNYIDRNTLIEQSATQFILFILGRQHCWCAQEVITKEITQTHWYTANHYIKLLVKIIFFRFGDGHCQVAPISDCPWGSTDKSYM